MTRLIAFTLVAAGLFVATPGASATTIVVTTSKDITGNDGRCSLREALSAAYSATASGPARGECPAGANGVDDVIQLRKKTTYELTRPSTEDEDNNNDGDLDLEPGVSAWITIRGSRGTKIVQRVAGQRVIENAGSKLALESVRVTGGNPTALPVPSGNRFNGGGILNRGDMRLSRVSVVGNHAGDPSSRENLPGGDGGGIYTEGDLTLDRSLVAYNTAGDGADATAATSAVHGGSGGGIFANGIGTVSIVASTIASNRAGDGGAGLDGGLLAPKGGGIGGSGGGIQTGSQMSVTASSIVGNRAGAGGDGGDGGTATSGAGHDGAPGGMAGGAGGILATNVTHIERSTIAHNRTGAPGAGGAGGSGAPPGVRGTDGQSGTGGGFVSALRPATLRNVTVSSNVGGRSAGGILAGIGTELELSNVTVARNLASAGEGGGLYYAHGASVRMRNSVIADNNAAGSGPDCHGGALDGITADAHNLVEVSGICSLGATDITGRDPRLDKLRSNGGGTATHALKRGSPALNAGNPAAPTGIDPACEPTDQRGKKRTSCDIGAFEGVKKKTRR